MQDPQLFDGTLRENVDPLKEYKDADIIDALTQCSLKNLLDTREGL